MKPTTHPPCVPVVVRDEPAGVAMLTGTPRTSSTTMPWEDGDEYPVIDVAVSSASRPFGIGRSRVLDTAGRVERFDRHYGKATR
ncbi:50S ribosomal protein L31 [Brachybacterium sp.]|uniref:50S ribosomal protein L31 n=1 Tax=Brachybacterium sp. TaxID=1891286 RepID=UPI002ED34445